MARKDSAMDKCCGTCKYHTHENISDGWVCCNGDSEYVTDWTDYEHCCEEWEGREQNGKSK